MANDAWSAATLSQWKNLFSARNVARNYQRKFGSLSLNPHDEYEEAMSEYPEDIVPSQVVMRDWQTWFKDKLDENAFDADPAPAMGPWSNVEEYEAFILTQVEQQS